MSYEPALEKAWSEIKALTKKNSFSVNPALRSEGQGVTKSGVKFLSDEYSIDLDKREILSLSCNAKAKDFYSILILHYLIEKLKGLPRLSGEWKSFQEFDGGQGYYPAFRKRAIEPIVRKYGAHPENLLELIERFPAKSIQIGDAGIVLEAFENVPALITLWKGDEEFGPEANMLFDRNIAQIFCTEDIAVLGGIIANLI